MGETLDRRLNRRKFLAAACVTIGAAALTLANGECDPAVVRRIVQSRSAVPPRHRVYVWEFSQDGTAQSIAERLAAHRLAVVVKTHDGLDWMAKYDEVPGAIDGPAQVETIAAIFEDAGVPFHAWAVVKGIDPLREAQMAAAVLDAGARSLTLDLEPYDGFWVGSGDDALRFGDELRARSEHARVDISIDPRPWELLHIPLREFAGFIDGFQPQIYWDMFDSPDNARAYAYMGYPPGPDGLTPEFLLDTTQRLLAPYDRWFVPIGLGAAADFGTWPRFAHQAWELQMQEVAVWRYGAAETRTLEYLGANAPPTEPQSAV